MCNNNGFYCFRVNRYDKVYAELGLPQDFILADGSNFDIVVFPEGGRFDFVMDDDEGFSYRKNKVKANGIYVRCVSCKATRVLHYKDNQVLLVSKCCLFDLRAVTWFLLCGEVIVL